MKVYLLINAKDDPMTIQAYLYGNAQIIEHVTVADTRKMVPHHIMIVEVDEKAGWTARSQRDRLASGLISAELHSDLDVARARGFQASSSRSNQLVGPGVAGLQESFAGEGRGIV